MSTRLAACLICPLLLLAPLAGAADRSSPFEARRLTPDEIRARPALGAIAGTSGLSGIRTRVLAGDPGHAGLYSIELTVPPQTHIAAHVHRDDRSAVVVAGTWRLGYGRVADDAGAKALGPGSFYTEPANQPHFAHTDDLPVTVIITGDGPTDTRYEADQSRP